MAHRLLAESLQLRRQLGIPDESGNTLALIAVTSIRSGDLVSARSAIREALDTALALRDRRAAWSLDARACLAAIEGSAETWRARCSAQTHRTARGNWAAA